MKSIYSVQHKYNININSLVATLEQKFLKHVYIRKHLKIS